MTHQNEIKSLRQFSSAEEYIRPLIQLSFQPIISQATIFSESDTDTTFTHFVIRPDGAGTESIGIPIDW